MADPTQPPEESKLDDVPQEVLERIAAYLTTEELGPLRCTCKQIETKLFNSFANEFFTKRQFMLEHESLEALVGISRHPGLAAKLTEVIIGKQSLSAGVELIKDRILGGRLCRDALLHTGTARDMLVEAFANLPNLRIVGLRDYDGAGRYREGRNARWRSWGWSFGFQGAYQDPGTVLPIILSALGQAQARPTNLEVILRRFPHLRTQAFQLPPGNLDSGATAVLAGLQTLMLAITGDNSVSTIDLAPWATYDDHNFVEGELRRFLTSATSLTNLRLNFENDHFIAHRIIHWLSRPTSSSTASISSSSTQSPPIEMNALRSLELGMANVSGEVLVKALTKFDLKSFSLWKMTLQCPGPDSLSKDCWAEFLEQLSAALPANTEIRSISIGHASQYHYSPSQPHSHGAASTSFVPEGTDPARRDKAARSVLIEFKAQFTNKPVRQWLKEMAESTFVPGIHTSLRSSSPISIDDSEGEGADEGSDSE